MAPPLETMLAAVVPGRVGPLVLSGEQKQALRDKDGKIALDVLRHTLGARAAIGAPERFSLTERAFQAVARKLGYNVAQKRAGAENLIQGAHAPGSALGDSGRWEPRQVAKQRVLR